VASQDVGPVDAVKRSRGENLIDNGGIGVAMVLAMLPGALLIGVATALAVVVRSGEASVGFKQAWLEQAFAPKKQQPNHATAKLKSAGIRSPACRRGQGVGCS
jgi:hypothetical protein